MALERILDEVDEAEVVARYRKGASEPQLAERFGVSRITIRRTLERLGEPPASERRGFKRQYDVDDALILQLRDELRCTWSEIATITGMRPGGVRRRYSTAKGVSLPGEGR